MFRLSALRDVERLKSDALAPWPAVPATLAGYDKWLERAGALTAKLSAHRAKRALGEQPVRDGNGGLILTPDSGVVFVLLPSGRFSMGAESSDSAALNRPPHASGAERSGVYPKIGSRSAADRQQIVADEQDRAMEVYDISKQLLEWVRTEQAKIERSYPPAFMAKGDYLSKFVEDVAELDTDAELSNAGRYRTLELKSRGKRWDILVDGQPVSGFFLMPLCSSSMNGR